MATSAGVYTTELDVSQQVRGASTSIGAIVGNALSGPVGVPHLVTSVKEFTDSYGLPDPTLGYLHHSAIAFLRESTQLYVVRVAKDARYGGCLVKSVITASTTIAQPFSVGYVDPTLYPFVDKDLFVLYGRNQGAWNNNYRVVIYPNTVVNDNTFWIEIYVGNNTRYVERFLCSLKTVLDGYGRQLNIESVINRNSKILYCKQNHLWFDEVASPDVNFVASVCSSNLVGGSNGTVPKTSDYLRAWETFRDAENIKINILINGGLSLPEIQLRMDEIATSRQDCIAILDVPSDVQAYQDAINYRRNSLSLDSSYSALYAPDLLINDEYTDKLLYVPPSGYMAAVYALTDRTRETWFAPAGMSRGHLNVRGVRFEYDQGQRDALADSQVNMMRVISGSGIKLWGADTLQTALSALSNINVRRLMIFLETSINDSLIYDVFDPNDFFLRSAITQRITGFLEPIKRGRGIYGGEVICDESNNSPETIANGDLYVDVFVDPVLPIKRIHLTAIINKTGSTVRLTDL